jgi:hypothetical protein
VQVESAKVRTWMLQLRPVGAHKGLALLGDGNGGNARHMAFWHSFAVGEALGVSIHVSRTRVSIVDSEKRMCPGCRRAVYT